MIAFSPVIAPRASSFVMLVAFVIAVASRPGHAQNDGVTFVLRAQAIGLLTRATHTPQGRTLSEGALTQPMLSADFGYEWFRATGTLNFEGLTLDRGELDPGAWGEGYVDRRHPHTYLHELVGGGEGSAGAVRFSLHAGRGFAPFGSDDPMSRPFVSYPVDHHLAQILERVIVIGALRVGPLTLEGGTFNGDEPIDPSTAPLFRRFGDSWSTRATVDAGALSSLLATTEFAASYANVKSPEYRAGAGMDQRKGHASLRFATSAGDLTRYALLEFARTTDVDRGRTLYTFDALLAEGAVCEGDVGVAGRYERSDRPEEERLLDLVRSARPATDLSILGVTRWTTLTAAVSLPVLRLYRAHVAPLLEVAHSAADRTSAALFDPQLFYRSTTMWRFSAGVRLGVGQNHGRMGRYGVASGSPHIDGGSSHQHATSSFHCFS
jgi:hypothetical protein